MNFDLPGVEPGSDIETLFKIIGFTTVQWGCAEFTLDLLVADIFDSLDNHPLAKSPRPRNLSQKLKVLAKCFTEIPELTQFRTESETLLPRFAAAGNKRNELIHGAISTLSIQDGAFSFFKIDIKCKESHSIRLVLLTEANWPDFRSELISLEKEGQYLVKRVRHSLKVRGLYSPKPHR